MGLTHPAVIAALVWLLLVGVDRFGRFSRARPAFPRVVFLAAGWTVLLAFGAIVIWYAGQFTYFDRAEPTITAVASVFSAGKPLYPALDAPERYAHIYGPVLFIVHASAMAVVGQSILVSKAVGAVAILGSLWIAHRIFGAQAGAFAAVVASSGCALIYLDFGNATFWTRPDPLLILCVVLGLYATRRGGRIGSLVLVGVATGLAINLKVSGPVYLVPVFALLASRHGGWSAMGAAGIATLVGLAPFLLPNVSMRHYAEYIELSARNGLGAAKMRQNLEWALVLVAPLAAVTFGARVPGPGRRGVALFVGSLATSVAVIAVVAAKPGGGPYHLLPFAPLVAYAALCVPVAVWERRATARALAAAVMLTALVIAVPRQATLLTTVTDRHLAAAVYDLRNFAGAHPSRRIGVGYAGLSYVSDARPEVVFRTRDYLLDAPAIQEHRLSGLDVPASTIHAIDQCQIDYWLLPTGADPFVVPSAYWPDGPREVFPEEFRRVFFRRYAPTGRTLYFDVWECQTR